MRNGRKRLGRSLAGACAFVAMGTAAACLSFGDLSGGEGSDASTDASAPDVVVTDVAPQQDAASVIDSGPVLYRSCKALHAALPSAPDGPYMLAADDGGAPINAYCDMTNDDGGWMLVTPDMIVLDTLQSITEVRTTDDNGGLIVEDYPNVNPCGAADAAALVPTNVITFAQHPAWSEIRARYSFEGLVSCWYLFGSTVLPATKNTVQFDPAVDIARDEVKMGGVFADGGPNDTFSGAVHQCVNSNGNFWMNNAMSARSLVLSLHRDVAGPAGLSTMMDCFNGVGPGTTSTSNWSYRDIYVR